MSLPLRTVDLLSCSHFYDWTTWYCTMMYLVDPIINREAAMHMATCIMRSIHCTRYCYQVSWVLSHFSPTVLLYLVQYYTTWLLRPSTYYGTWYSSVLISEVPTYLVDPTSTLFPFYTCTMVSSVHLTRLPHTWYQVPSYSRIYVPGRSYDQS